MTNVLNAESAVLAATARHKTWLDNFFRNWSRPLMDAMMVRWFETLPPDMRDQAKAADPEGFAQVERNITSLRERVATEEE